MPRKMAKRYKTKYLSTSKFLEELSALLGVRVKVEMLRSWAREGLITKPLKKRPVGNYSAQTTRHCKGQGRSERFWKRVAFYEAAAVWAVRNRPPKKRVSKRDIEEIKKITQCFCTSPQANYEPKKELDFRPRFSAPSPNAAFNHLWWGIRLSENDRLDALAKTWIMALVKGWGDVPLSKPKKVAFHWFTPPFLNIPLAFINLRRLEFVAKVSRKSSQPILASRMRYEFMGITLDDSPSDELLVFVDGQDMRRKAAYAPFQAYTGETYSPYFTSSGGMIAPQEESVDVDFEQSIPGSRISSPDALQLFGLES